MRTKGLFVVGLLAWAAAPFAQGHPSEAPARGGTFCP
jgi:hypothetical protein